MIAFFVIIHVNFPKMLNRNMSYLAYKFRLYPNKEQETKFNQTLGSCRFVWNYMLNKSIEHHKETGNFLFKFSLNKLLPDLKKEFDWLKEPNSQSLQDVNDNIDKAFRNCFRSKFGFPKFKSKKSPVQSFKIPQHFQLLDKHIKLPKIGLIRYKKHRDISGEIKSLIITKDVSKWFVVVLVEQDDVCYQVDMNKSIGIDLGIKDFVVMSDGTRYNYPDTIKNTTKRIKKLQRQLAKKKKGSRNKEKARILLANKNQKLRFQKNDCHNKIASSITKNYDVISMENLNVKGMLKNRKLSRSIHESAWSSLKSKIKNKAKLYSEIDRFYPSTKTCSECGYIKEEISLSERTFSCENCNYVEDRDINAAKNINRAGIARIYACGDTTFGIDDESSIRNVSLKQEALIL